MSHHGSPGVWGLGVQLFQGSAFVSVLETFGIGLWDAGWLGSPEESEAFEPSVEFAQNIHLTVSLFGRRNHFQFRFKGPLLPTGRYKYISSGSFSQLPCYHLVPHWMNIFFGRSPISSRGIWTLRPVADGPEIWQDMCTGGCTGCQEGKPMREVAETAYGFPENHGWCVGLCLPW